MSTDKKNNKLRQS